MNRLSVFLSYASEQESLAEQIYLTLANAGHTVFFDRTNLPPGQDFNPAILNAIRSSDVMVFLVSPHSVADGCYARTELRFARETWPNPAGRFLPVMAAPTDYAAIPNYVKAVTILTPEGNVPAEVAAAVNDIATNRKPQDTVAGQKAQLAGVQNQLEEIARERDVERLDRRWERERETHMVTYTDRNGRSEKSVPSKVRSIFGGLVGMIAGLVLMTSPLFKERPPQWLAVRQDSETPLLDVGLGLLFFVIGLGGAIYGYSRAKNYERAEQAYRQRRRAALDHRDATTAFFEELDRSDRDIGRRGNP